MMGSRSFSRRLRSSAVLLTALAAALTLVSLPGSAGAARRPPRPGLDIVFTVTGVDPFQLARTNALGTKQRRLTAGPYYADTPRWAPFGKRILYLRSPLSDDHFPDLMVMGARGGHKHLLIPGGHRYYINDMDWGPTGKTVALVIERTSDGRNGIYFFSMRTHRLTQLKGVSAPKRSISSLDWSRDGKSIIFVASEADAHGLLSMADLYRIGPDGTGLRRLTNTPTLDESNAAWSPDSRRLLYSSHRPAMCGGSVFISSADGSDPRRVPVRCQTDWATWSADGRGLLVQDYDRQGNELLFSIAFDGTHRRFVTRGARADWRMPR